MSTTCICCGAEVAPGMTYCPNCLVSSIRRPPAEMTIDVECQVCHTKRQVMVPAMGYLQWSIGQVRIQDAMPRLSAEDRELLISQICPTCWDKLFKEG